MKKLVYRALLLLLFCFGLTGCGRQAKITELENEIGELEKKITTKEAELEDWQEIFDVAYNTYYASHSSNMAIQAELERTKEYMDEAKKHINDINRAIALYELELEYKEKELAELKE